MPFSFLRNLVFSQKSYLRSGENYIKQGNFDEAIKNLTTALSLTPDGSDISRIHYALGFCFYKKNDFYQAIQSENAAISLNRSNFDYYCIRGFAHLFQQHFSLAIADCVRAIEISDLATGNEPKMPHEQQIEINNAIAFGYLFEAKLILALDYFNRALLLVDQPDSKTNIPKGTLLHNRGLVYEQQNNQQKAFEDFQAAWQYTGVNSSIKISAGLYLLKLKEYSAFSYSLADIDSQSLLKLVRDCSSPPEETPEMLSKLVIAAHQLKDFALLKKNIDALFKHNKLEHFPYFFKPEIAMLLTAWLEPKLWPAPALISTDFNDIKMLKRALFAFMESLEDPVLKQNALCQSLMASTVLGSVFNVHHALVKTTFLSNTQINIADLLAEEIAKNGNLLTEPTKTALATDTPLKNALLIKHPDLYAKLGLASTNPSAASVSPMGSLANLKGGNEAALGSQRNTHNLL